MFTLFLIYPNVSSSVLNVFGELNCDAQSCPGAMLPEICQCIFPRLLICFDVSFVLVL
jgi:hypothetical protein